MIEPEHIEKAHEIAEHLTLFEPDAVRVLCAYLLAVNSPERFHWQDILNELNKECRKNDKLNK